jgi:hypothetical protein
MQAEWSRLMTELSRVSALRAHLNVIDDVCSRMEASGAPRYAAALRNPVEGTIDRLLPNNWRVTWRLRRLAAHLETIDPRQELKKLADDRRAIEGDLARAYQEIVVRRTWLKLAENASPSTGRLAGIPQRDTENRQRDGQACDAIPPGRARGGRAGQSRCAVLDYAALPGFRIAPGRAGVL